MSDVTVTTTDHPRPSHGGGTGTQGPKGDKGDPGQPGAPGGVGPAGPPGWKTVATHAQLPTPGLDTDVYLTTDSDQLWTWDTLNTTWALIGPTTGGAGTPGTPGASAYDLWLAAGNTGTVTQFLASLVGAAGTPGTPGTAGATGPPPVIAATHTTTVLAAGAAPTVAVAGTGTAGDPLAFAFGIPAGPAGAAGAQGPVGPSGASGQILKRAFGVAVQVGIQQVPVVITGSTLDLSAAPIGHDILLLAQVDIAKGANDDTSDATARIMYGATTATGVSVGKATDSVTKGGTEHIVLTGLVATAVGAPGLSAWIDLSAAANFINLNDFQIYAIDVGTTPP